MLLTVVLGDVLLHHQLADQDHHLLVTHLLKYHQHHLQEVYLILLFGALEVLRLLQHHVHELIHRQQLSRFNR